jgi:hypothetical protein
VGSQGHRKLIKIKTRTCRDPMMSKELRALEYAGIEDTMEGVRG